MCTGLFICSVNVIGLLFFFNYISQTLLDETKVSFANSYGVSILILLFFQWSDRNLCGNRLKESNELKEHRDAHGNVID